MTARPVTLLSNIYHYNPTAEALHDAGLLERYITSWTLFNCETAPAYLPAFYRNKLEGRRLNGVPKDKVTRFLFPELLQKALPSLPFSSSTFATDVNNCLFDLFARSKTKHPAILHFVNTLGFSVSKEVRRRGGIAVCDSRQEHPTFQRELLLGEAEKRGALAPPFNQRADDRTLGEFESAHLIIVPSSFARRTLVDKGVDRAKIAIVPYGADVSVFPQRTRTETATFTILFVGSLSLRKGILYLLEAVNKLRLPKTQVICVGRIDSGMEPLLYPYRDLFIHIPNVPKVKMKEYYQIADIFVLPSLTDSYALVALEAAVSGLPIILTSNVGASDTLVNGQNCLVVPPADSEALGEAILKLFTLPALRNEMRSSNLRLAPKLSWSTYKKAMIRTYKEKILKF